MVTGLTAAALQALDPRLRLQLYGLGNYKNELVDRAIKTGGVEVYGDSIAWARIIKNRVPPLASWNFPA